MHNWRKTILKESNTMQDAVKVLDEEALGIVMILNEDNKLIGTVTDGDIRRGLIKHLSMNTVLSEVMFREPTVATIDDDSNKILMQMKVLGLMQIPLLDKEKRVVGLETLHHVLSNNRRENPVFLMAGGFGKRLQPLTNNTPKPLLKVGAKPILESILEQFIEAGFYNFYISIHFKAEMVRDYFGDGSKWNVNIKYVFEESPLGTAGSLGLLPKNLPDMPILMMNGDLLTKVDFVELLNFHLHHGGDATMCVREYDLQVPYGVVKSKDHLITSIEEKPKHSFFVNAGIYVLNSSMFQDIDGKSYIDMPTLIQGTIDNSGQINMFPVHEYWLDIGHINQFEKAQEDYDNF
ncbi:nucleotidyltransferase family protein [Candidatus Thioglobus sp.]|nr:nucleotidyltransferase family protein [Candidatus Thioglobus sp.]MDC1418124.1 nucleotidyltransferase family protein [Candidatus Thioglobus sp.]